MQIMLLDTPGLHDPQNKLGEYMVKVAEETVRDADLILWLVDINVPPKEEDRRIAELLQRLQSKKNTVSVVIGLNKRDQLSGTGKEIDARAQEYLALVSWLPTPIDATLAATTCAISGLTGQGIDELFAAIRQRLPVGPRYYPEDQVTDMELRFITAELIREQALRLLEQEVPHSLAVEVDEFSERNSRLTYISAVLYVERDSQKAIVLGENGSMIKKIGQAARPEIEELVGTRVYLELWVKVWEKWRTRESTLRRLGYALQK